MPEDNLSSKYFEGKPCRKCRSTLRYVSSKHCINCQRKSNQKWCKANLEKYHKYHRKWRQANLEKQHERCRKWQQENPEKIREKIRNWQKNNHERFLKINQTSQIKTRAKRAKAEGSYTTQQWIDLKEQYGNRCLCCGRHQSELDRVLEQDHIVPLSRGGTNWITNIQPLCHTCNDMGHKGIKIIDYRITMA